MTAKYCVFGEGSNDIGDVEFGQLMQEGCYSGFLKTAKSITNLKCVKAERLANIKTPGPDKNRTITAKLKGFRHHAYYAARMAATAGADFLIIGTDVDRGRGAQSRQLDRERHVRKYREEFEEGYRIACAENPAVKQIRIFVIVPLCKLEAWLLADEKAFSAATGFQRDKLPNKPEELYGETDPKKLLSALFAKNGGKTARTPVLYEIAVKSSPAVLKKMCPVSYTPFLEQCKS